MLDKAKREKKKASDWFSFSNMDLEGRIKKIN